MAKRAEARYVISADDRTRQGTMSAEMNFRRMGKSVMSFQAAAIAAAAAVAVAVRGIVSSVASSARDLDAIAKRAKGLGVSPQTLAASEFAAGKGGVSEGGFGRAVERLQLSIDKALGGDKEMQELFARVGLSAADLGKESPALAALQAIQQFQRVELAGGRTDESRQGLLGRNTSTLAALDLGAFAQDLELFQRQRGNINEQAAAAENTVDNMTDLGNAATGLKDALAGPGGMLGSVIDAWIEAATIVAQAGAARARGEGRTFAAEIGAELMERQIISVPSARGGNSRLGR